MEVGGNDVSNEFRKGLLHFLRPAILVRVLLQNYTKHDERVEKNEKLKTKRKLLLLNLDTKLYKPY